MRVAAVELEDGSRIVGLSNGGPMLDYSAALAIYQTASGSRSAQQVRTPLELIQQGLWDERIFDSVLEFVDKHRLAGDLALPERHRLLAPIARPPAIYALGRNYPAHARESGKEPPKEPVIFGKSPTAVIGPEEPVVYKKWLTRVDPEAEFAVVLRKGGANVPEDAAMALVAGYTCVNDVTARDMQSEDLAVAHPWLRSKGIDTFCPIGPWIVLRDEIAEPIRLDVQMRVNGEVRQRDNTGSMTFDVRQLIAFISRHMTLYPGDVISTGTPEGMKPVFPGDVMEVEVERIGVLRNPVVAES